jgi:RNA polymerase sigma-70 factor (ECF subfamily)
MAIAEIEGPAIALAEIEHLAADKRMSDYRPYWAARGHLLGTAGRRTEAFEALTIAIGLSADDAVRRYLLRRRDQLGLAG